MSKALDAGKTFADGLLAKLPESLRESVKTALLAPEAADALSFLGDGTLARADYSRSKDELGDAQRAIDEYKSTLDGWYETRKQELDQVDRLKQEGKWGKEGVTPPTPPRTSDLDTSKFLDRDTFAKELEARDRAAAGYLAVIQTLTLNHYRDFQEVIDPNDLLADPNLGKAKQDGRVYGIADAYQSKYSDKLTTRAKEQEDARINKLVAERFAEAQKGAGLPIPLKNGSPSPLDLLDQSNVDTKLFTAEAAAEEYARLQAGRG